MKYTNSTIYTEDKSIKSKKLYKIVRFVKGTNSNNMIKINYNYFRS